MNWEPVIGLEIHIHLKTRTKMFCRCEVAYSEPENTRTCPVCLAYPGSLALDDDAFEDLHAAALALDHLEVDTDRVAGLELRQVCPQLALFE